MAVSGPVVEAEDRIKGILEAGHIGESLVASGRILYKDHLQDIAAEFKSLHTAKSGAHIGKRLDRFLRGETERLYRGNACGGIVNIVYGGKRYEDLFFTAVRAHVDHASVRAHLVNGGDSDIRSVTAVAALGTAETSEVRVNMIVIFVFTAAFRALACVGEVSLALFAYRLLKAVPDNFIGDIQCKRSRLCILCVENENGSRTALNAFADLGESILHAAETVSLISEQICDHDHFGADIRNDLFEGRLVNFEYRIAVPGFAEPVCVTDQVGSNTVKQVRARFVAMAVVTVLRKDLSRWQS